MRRTLFAVAAMAAVSLVAAPAVHAQLRVEKNHRLVSDPNVARGKDAVGLAVNPQDPRHIVELNADWLTGDCEYTVSTDGGTTWSAAKTFVTPPPSPGMSPFASTCQPEAHVGQPVDRGIAFGSGQNVYATFAAPRTSLLGDEGSSVLVAKSTDGGRNFGTAVVALPGGPLPSPGPDYGFPKLAVVAGAQGDTIYLVAAESESGASNVTTTVSTDSGASWSSPVNANPSGSAAESTQPVVLPDGSVSVGWRRSGDIVVARSTNSQATAWNAPVVVATGVDESYPRLAVDRSGGSGNGNLYIVYGQGQKPGAPAGGFQGADHFIDLDMDVYFQRSTDGGTKWTEPIRINDATVHPGTDLTQTRHPEVSVAPNGRVDVVWQDRRHWYRGCPDTHDPCDEPRLGDTYYAFSTNAATAPAPSIAFSENHRITDRSHNNDVGFDYRFGAYWDFGPVVVPLGTDELLVGWMDTRDGNFETDTQDIFLARVDHSGPAAVPQETIPLADPSGLSVRLSQLTYPGGAENVLAGTFATRPEGAARVVIVNEEDTAGILAASVLARANLSQVLLSPSAGLPSNVKAEVTRMTPAGAYIVGNETMLSSQIEADLDAAGVPDGEVERLSGGSDAATAALIAKELDRRTQAEKDANDAAFDAVIIANPASPDAAAASALAAARRLPFLYANTTTPVPQETTDALAELDIDKTLVIGGTDVVSDAVKNALPAAERLDGADQYATSQAVVAESIKRGLPTNIAYVADGSRPLDAALLGSVAGRSNGLLILAPAPLNTSAAAIADQLGLNDELDRLLLVQPAAVPGGGGPGGGPLGGFAQVGVDASQLSFARCRAAGAVARSGTGAGERLVGTAGVDLIFAGAGDDVVDGLAGDDCLDLGPGVDVGQGGVGNDLILGGVGADRASGSSGNDNLRGNPGDDRLFAGRGNDWAFGDAGNDRIFGSFGNDRLHGVSGDDRIAGSRGRDRINGGSGKDRISGGSSPDRIRGDAGNDRVSGNSGNDRVSGNSGNDRLRGSAGRDRISGGSGRDRIHTRDGRRDRINCGRGRDTVTADRFDRVAANCELVRRN